MCSHRLCLSFFYLITTAFWINIITIITNITTGSEVVKGYDFNAGLDYDAMFKAYGKTGLQATNLALAIEEVNLMLNWEGEKVEQVRLI